MKISFPTIPHWQAGLLCLFLSFTAQGVIAAVTTNTTSSMEVFHYGFAAAIIVLIIASVILIRRARRVLNEHGRPLFSSNSSIFKGMTKSKTTVAIVIILLVLWGVYSVLTYKGI